MKYFAIPHPYEIEISLDISKKCNLNCSYCIGVCDPHNDLATSTDEAKKVLKYFPANITISGVGEPMFDCYEKIIDLLQFIKDNNLRSRVCVLTNGQFPDRTKKLLNDWENIIFLRSIALGDSETSHNEKYIIWHPRVYNKLLVRPNDNFLKYEDKIKNDSNFYLKTLTYPNNYKDFNGSFLEKYLKENKDVLQKITPSDLRTKGYFVSCIGNVLIFQKQCIDICFREFLKDDKPIVQSVLEYKAAMYDYLTKNSKNCCCLNKENNLEDLLLDLYNKDELERDTRLTELLYDGILSEKVNKEGEIINITTDVLNGPIITSSLKQYNTLFNNQIFPIDIQTLFSSKYYNYRNYDDVFLLTIPMPSYNNQIGICGKYSNLIKIFSEPNKYRIAGDIYDKVFRFVLKYLNYKTIGE